jgi:NAD(P)-dependent dehydrogenase (short-subunit alcohol dehydrogenase family)
MGAALVDRHRKAGHDVVVWDRKGDVDHLVDILDPEAVRAAAQATGRCDLVTVTAGIGHQAKLLDANPEEFDRVLGINTRGLWLAMRELARPMIDAGTPGSIIGVTSVSARLVDAGMGLYCASKAAAEMIVKIAAAEWGPQGIRVNAVAPGVTATPMLPGATDSPWLTGVAQRTSLKRLGTSEDLAEAILAVHGMGWVHGQVVVADGGLMLHSPISPTA